MKQQQKKGKKFKMRGGPLGRLCRALRSSLQIGSLRALWFASFPQYRIPLLVPPFFLRLSSPFASATRRMQRTLGHKREHTVQIQGSFFRVTRFRQLICHSRALIPSVSELDTKDTK
uniref:Uncharacterized protein n=1 Tax=Trypanosoma vivax (strain Y486) TaxID=1055687 RepID=G0UC66_TRYVY|nr:hypothetical protein TVY486_1108980 [Trypanosoma vivax Y486]